MPGESANNEIQNAVKKQKDLRENLDESSEAIYVDASRNIAVSLGSKDLRWLQYTINTCNI